MGRRPLDARSAEIEMISYGKMPTSAYSALGNGWAGRCLWNGHSSSASLANARRQGPCKKCGRAKASAAQRLQLSKVVRDLESKGVIVIGEYINNRTRIECICIACGELTFPTYSNARREGVGLCDNQCKGSKISASKLGDAAVAAILAQSHLLIPLRRYTGANDLWPLRCLICGHAGGKTTYGGIYRLGHMCSRCGRVRAGKALRLTEAEAIQNMIDADLRPDGPYPGIHIQWPCTCLKCGLPVDPGPRLHDIRNGGQGGCTNCADTSFKQNDPAYVYIVLNEAAGFLKWGKANDVANRRREHARQGFRHVAGCWAFDKGVQASAMESALGRAIRALGARTRIEKKLMPYKGYTETASLEDISLDEAVACANHLSNRFEGTRLTEASPPQPVDKLPDPNRPNLTNAGAVPVQQRLF